MLEKNQELLGLMGQYLGAHGIAVVEPSNPLSDTTKIRLPKVGDAVVSIKELSNDHAELSVRTLVLEDIKQGQFIQPVMRPLARAAIVSGHFQVGEVLNVSHVGFTKFEEFRFDPKPSKVLVELVRGQLQEDVKAADSEIRD